MKIQFTKDWCVRMAQMEIEAGSDMEIGAAKLEARTDLTMDANVTFGRFVRLLRRSRRQSLEHLADEAEIETGEIYEKAAQRLGEARWVPEFGRVGT